ncbi:hypothetical protein TNCT_409371 [Trichonephila clavata]|uniref:Uncharacterized protein n=1 Tax=Trichonephila clavata TaxID=2740835 RepID=A0A8X6FWN0_TRICU|nr:hypothetical protein TNCT_409371 [Trichonephila clavata]
MIKRSEETGKLRVQPGRGHKRITPVFVDGAKTAVDAESQTLEIGRSSDHLVSQQTGSPYSTVRKVFRSTMHYFPHKIRQT